MVTSIVEVVRQFKQGWTEQLSGAMIDKACREVDYKSRNRVLNPVVTLQLFMLQILHGNTAMTHLPRLARMEFTASAYCQARMRLPLAVFRLLLRRVAESLGAGALDQGRWFGHRVFFIDGSGLQTVPGFTIANGGYRHDDGSSGAAAFDSGRSLVEFSGGSLNGQAALFEAGPPVRLRIYNETRSRTVIDCPASQVGRFSWRRKRHTP